MRFTRFDATAAATIGVTTAICIPVAIAQQVLPDADQINAVGGWQVYTVLGAVCALCIAALMLALRWMLQTVERISVRTERQAVALQRMGDGVVRLADIIAKSPYLVERLRHGDSELPGDILDVFERAKRELHSTSAGDGV